MCISCAMSCLSIASLNFTDKVHNGDILTQIARRNCIYHDSVYFHFNGKMSKHFYLGCFVLDKLMQTALGCGVFCFVFFVLFFFVTKYVHACILSRFYF